MADNRWEGDRDDRVDDDHDAIVKLMERVRNLQEEVRVLKADNKLLMSDRAKLIGWCGGVSGLAAIIVKLFWPAH